MDDCHTSDFVVKISVKPEIHSYSNTIRHRFEKRNCNYFLLVFETPQKPNETDWLKTLLKRYAQQYRLYNVVVLYQLEKDILQLATYLPYTNAMMSLPVTAFLQEELFFDKVTNFYGKPLRVAIFPEKTRAMINSNGLFYRGTDFEMARLFANDLNASLEFHLPPDGDEYGNPITATNGSGSLGQIMRNEVDLSINSRFLRLDLFRNNNIAEATMAIGRDDMCVLIPVLGYRSAFYNFIHLFDVWVWIFIFGIIFPVTYIIRLSTQFNFTEPMIMNRDRGARGKDENAGLVEKSFQRFSYIDTIRGYLNQMIRLRSEQQTLTLRLIVVTWLIYCCIMTSVFQCYFTSMFTVNWMQTFIGIRNIKDLTESNYRIMAAVDYDGLIRRYFNGTTEDDILRKKILMKMRPVNWTTYNYYLAKNDISFVYANKMHLTNYYASVKHKNGNQIFYSMRECLIPFLVCYIVPFGSPILNRINVVIGRLQNAGIFQYLDKQVNAVSIEKHFIRFKSTPEALRLENVLYAFYFLFLGFCFAFGCLVFEIRRFNRQNRSYTNIY